jgi:putative ABC transport system permease protein
MANKGRTPAWANWLVSRFVDPKLLEELLGDLQEMYDDRLPRRGRVYADLMHLIDVVHLIIAFGSVRIPATQNDTTMINHYLTSTIRSLTRTKLHSLINITSLAVGMGVCLVICQYIYFEMSYDQFHDNYENTYRVIIEEVNTDLKETSPAIGYSFGISAKEEIPEVRQFMRQQRFNRGAIVTNPANGLTFHEEVNDLLFVDHSFFQMFNYPLKRGKSESLFNDKYSVVITEDAAKKYFGDDDPIGKTLKIDGPPSPGDYTVTGVLEVLPLNSHMQFDFLVPITNYLEFGWSGAVKKRGGWNGFSVATYLTLDESARPDLVRQKLNELIARHNNSDVVKRVILQPISDIYMKSNIYSDAGFVSSLGNMDNIRVISVVAFLILVIAWANYINLATARAMLRSKEVGVRKSIGAFRKQLIGQFVFESVLINVLAAILAIGIGFLLLPYLNNIIGKEMPLSLLQNPMFWAWFLATILLGSLLSGLYPAFVLSSFKPISMLGANRVPRIGSVNLRRALIGFQFLISLLLISSTYLVYKQTSYMKGQDLSVELEKILVLRSQRGASDPSIVQSDFNSFSNEMLAQPVVSAITSSTVVPGQFGVNPYRRLGQPEGATPYTRSIFAGEGFSETYGLKFIAGGPFTEDMKEEAVLLINESAIEVFGFESAERAIQQKLVIGDQQRTIVGVVENFDWHSRKEPHLPYVISLTNERQAPYISVRMNTRDIAESLAQVKSAFNSSYPDQPFDYFFADDAFNRQYQSEIQFGKVFFSFSSLAILIACAGLFALVSFSATARIKEIGIRKVLGADIRQLVALLSREYIVLISLAALVAFPMIWYWGSLWLSNYATRIHIGIDLFVIPVMILIIIAGLTVSHKTVAAALANPVDSLRTE